LRRTAQRTSTLQRVGRRAEGGMDPRRGSLVHSLPFQASGGKPQAHGVIGVARKRSYIVDLAIYLLVRLGLCVIQAIGFEAAKSLAAWAGGLVYRLDRRHRCVAQANLRLAFPDRFRPKQLESLTRSVYVHFCTVLVEMAYLPRKLHPTNYWRYLDLRDKDKTTRWHLSGRPLLVVSGHFGNWELAGYAMALLGCPTSVIARPLDNPFLDRFLRDFRKRNGQTLLAKKGELDRVEVILKQTGTVSLLADQDAGQRGLFVDFFGRPASTHKSIALLSLAHSAPVMVIGCRKIGEPMRYEWVMEDIVLPEEYDGRSDAVAAITQRFTSALERLIRSAPEQYFWLHRRWKHAPVSRPRRAAA
jgi:Kdo2-lipid IVA lauroyltransferase/acyltransferase